MSYVQQDNQRGPYLVEVPFFQDQISRIGEDSNIQSNPELTITSK